MSFILRHLISFTPILPLSQALAKTNLLSVYIYLLFLGILYKWNHTICYVCLLSLNIFKVYPSLPYTRSSFLCLNNIPLYEYTTLKKLLHEFYYIYSCTTIITTQFYNISIPTPAHRPVSLGKHKFFTACASVSVLQRRSLCPYFIFHM